MNFVKLTWVISEEQKKKTVGIPTKMLKTMNKE